MDAPARHATLDVMRGLAVMGILLANIVAYGLPEGAYYSPLAWGGQARADRIVWFVNFVFVEGRLRGLFSFLFGASMLLVIERAEAAGGNGAAVHLRRMVWLFAIGCAHLYLFWWGDILAHYALVGVLALFFHRLAARTLLLLALLVLALAMLGHASEALALFASAARITPAQVATWDAYAGAFGVPPPARLLSEVAATRGGFVEAAAWRWRNATDPFSFALYAAPETLSAMLLGMAALRAGFLTGAWSRRAYVRVALACVPLSLAAYAALGWVTLRSGFDQRWVFVGSVLASAPFRVIGVAGYAAVVVLWTRRRGASGGRVAAVGRAAFSNYLATTLVMDLVFCGWGLGLFGRIPRAALYLFVPPVWLMMLAWSRPWLNRFHYGPLEWLWRSLSRGARQPIRRRDATNR